MRFPWDSWKRILAKAWTWTGIQTFGTIISTTQSGGFDEVVKASSGSLAVTELRGQVITNYGQGAEDNLQELPTAVEGLHGRFRCGTAQAANYFRAQADTNDKIYLDGVAGADNGSVSIAVPVVGAWISYETFQTGATTWDWIFTTGFGNWVAV